VVVLELSNSVGSRAFDRVSKRISEGCQFDGWPTGKRAFDQLQPSKIV